MHCDRGKTNIAGNNAHGNNTLCVSGSGSNFPDYGIALLVVGAVLIVALLVAFIMYVVFFLSLTLFFISLCLCMSMFSERTCTHLYTYPCSYVKRKSKRDNDNECGGLDDDEESGGPDDENEYRLVESEHGD